jgi:tRNA(fMet)-specific endonuclease VapC
MKFMLDTDCCIYLIKRSRPALTHRVLMHPPAELAISSITLGELAYGARRSQQAKRNRQRLSALVEEIQVLPFDAAAAQSFGEVRATLERKGTPIGPFDLLIAGHARSLGLVLVTNNVTEFRRVQGLKIENWASGDA